MIRITDQYFWNVVFIVFYLCFLGMGVVILHTESYRNITELTVTDFILMALATHRLIRLFVYDSMTKFFREQFYDAVQNKRGEVVLLKPDNGPRRTLADLLTCLWCFGVWAASTVVFFYLFTPYAYIPVLILALSSVGSTLQLITNLIGHKAEHSKRQNEELS
jgi:fatty acid desaturase